MTAVPGKSDIARLARGLAAGGADVVHVAPTEVGTSFGRETPEQAIARSGGVPSSRPERALLVVVNDPDRATPTAPVLAALRRRIGKRAIHILVATGSHRWSDVQRAAHEAPLRAAAGDPATIDWHDGSDAAGHATAGWARLDRRLLAAGDIVAIGSVEPHWFAGVTGAHKTLTVGLMLRDDIARNHRLALDPEARPLVTYGNPVFEGHVSVLRQVLADRRVLAVESVGDRWIAGDVEDVIEDCVDAARARWGRTLSRELDFLVTAIEPPLSRSLYQAEKGVKLGEDAVRDGGAIVLVATCEDGVGPSRFIDLLRRAPDEATARDIVDAEGYQLGDHKAVRLRALTDRGVRLALLSASFDEATARVAGFQVVRDHTAASAWITSIVGASGHGALVADGGHIVLEVEE
ncbi:MAG: lactate racemase domain-containing protein [Planctomycetes bacterium]|nr:lactate racemase domain-containing protein [Planctomycetota bacterium]